MPYSGLPYYVLGAGIGLAARWAREYYNGRWNTSGMPPTSRLYRASAMARTVRRNRKVRFSTKKQIKYARAYRKKAAKKFAKETPVLDEQHASKVVLNPTLPSKRSKRVNRKFASKVYAVLERQLGKFSLVRNHDFDVGRTPVAATATQDIYAASVMGALYDNTNTNEGDLWDMILSVEGTKLSNTRLRIHSWSADVYMLNTHATNACFVDIYYLKALITVVNSASTQLGTLLGGQTVLPGGTATMFTVNGQGVTPFEAPGFFKEWKLYKKRRFYIRAGDTVNFQDIAKVNRIVGANDLRQNASATGNVAFGGITKTLLFIVTGEPTATASPSSFTKAYNLKVLINKSFKMTHLQGDTDSQGKN